MIYRKSLYNKKLNKRRMITVITFGIVFLISTIAYYFVSLSSAQNVLKAMVYVIDEEAEVEITNYELKVPEESGGYIANFEMYQNGFKIKKYTVATEKEFNDIKSKYEGGDVVTNENETDETSKNEDTNIENNSTDEIQKESEETNDEEKNTEITNGEKYELSTKEIEQKKIYLIAQYDYKEQKGKKLYNKVLSNTANNNSINITGYMPKDSTIKVSEVEKTGVEDIIKGNFQDVNKNVNLESAYDIKIVSKGNEYEPEDFGESVKVSITGVDGKTINVWHVKDDNTVEMMESYNKNDSVSFNSDSFSIYGVEVVEEEEKVEETDESFEINNSIKAAPRRAPARNLPDSILEIDDYTSDYYYYLGQNYTSDISGENQEIYSESDMARVTVNYYGFAEGETDEERKGRISFDETQDIVKNIRCLPIVNGSVSIELMDNPFMDKPTGYGFGGWTSSAGQISKDSHTNVQTLTVSTSGDIVVNVYANWQEATVVYVNGEDGNDNLNDGLTEDKPFGSWEAAFKYISSHNKSDREKNIIVVTGDLDTSINYTRPITQRIAKPADVTFTSSTTVITGTEVVLATNTGNNGNAITASGSGVVNTQLSTNELPPDEIKWIITVSGNGNNARYTIYNPATNMYLACSSSGVLSMSSTATQFRYNNRRFYYTGNRYSYYLRYRNGSWTTSTSSYNGQQFYFLTYTAVVDENAEEIITTTRGSLAANTYYSTSQNIPVTVTSLYNHTDYRSDATIDLTTSNYDDFDIRADFQMNHVKINASGYTTNNDGTTFSTSYPWLTGYAHNVRLGRGIQCANTQTAGCTFANVIGGATSVTNNYNNAYKLVVESGKYSSIQGFNRNGATYSYYGTVFLTLGNDIDRKDASNDDLSVYNITTINSGGGTNGKSNIREKAWLINVKSGKFGTDFFDTNGANDVDSAYAGIYMGGYGASSSNTVRDISDRYMIVEGGLIANIIGGLKTTSNSGVLTKLYMKGGEAYNIVGGAGVSATYEDRFIQITGGKVRYSVSGGSNGVYASSTTNNGKLNGDTLVYVGGTAQIGTDATLSSTVYGVKAGCVLGAGNGNYDYRNSGAGQVYTTHILVNDSAHILNSVYGGGNYGIVGTSGSTTGNTKIDIMGGTIDQNVYGGANQNNIYGSTTINVSGGQVKGAVYGGSNSEGTISTTSNINVTGGTLGEESNGTDEVLFGGGYGASTIVTNDATVNIFDTDDNVNIYGSCYGGSSLGRMSQNVTVTIKDDPSIENTINIVGNVFAGGKGNAGNAATINGDATLLVDGNSLSQASVFGGNDINGVTNGDITVKIGEHYSSQVLNVYGGGNEDDTGTEADTVKVYLLDYANVTNAFNGGKSANLTTGGVSDTTRAIYLRIGHAQNIFGGSDTSGTVTASHVYIESGTADNVYGGNNEGGTTTTSYVYITGGTTTNVYGGGYLATTPTTNVSLTGGTITNGFGGGNAANVGTANITLNGTNSTNIYGGSNSSGTVTKANVTITSGAATNVFGGNNAGGDTVDTDVLITSQVKNVYGGGNEAITSGNTNLRLTNANITGDAYGGGNGAAAVVVGNSTTLVEGTTRIADDLFGGGNAAANGNLTNTSAVVTTLITGGTIAGDVYGAANTSVVNGNTFVKIGTVAVNNNTMLKGTINIGGTVFGGGKSNSAGSETYDFSFESVTGDANIDIDATGYDDGTYSFNIGKSVFGSGNAAKISGYGIVNITNYGTASSVKENVSIQRATTVTLNNCHMYLEGTTDTTNEIATAVYTFNRIDDLIIKNNTTLYLESGVNIVSKMESLNSSGAKETVTIGDNGITNQNVNNKIYVAQGRNIILRTEAGTDGEVYGMAFVGLFKGSTNREFGIYGNSYTQGSSISSEVADLFNRNSYVQGKHYNNHNIKADGFYTNYNDNGVVKVDYITPTPEDATYYQWIMGEKSTDIYYEDIELIATKYATTATYVLNLNGLSYPNMTINVVGFDVSELTGNITLNDPGTIPNIASTAQEADSKFGLTMTTGNNGWQTKGTTMFLNNNDVQAGYDGKLQYLSDNSTTTPTFSLYMAHSKNISTTSNLGKATIKLEAIYEENEEIKIKNVFIVLKLTTNNTLQMGTDYYEGAITPGKEYSIFPTTTTTITQNSSFSAYYSLYLNNYSTTNYYEGFVGHYYHSLQSTCVLPENTKITLIDMSGSSVKYYYYIVSQQDENDSKKVYNFTDFWCMDSTDEKYSADGSYYNQNTDLLYEEYIVQVDFEDIELQDNLESNSLVVQLRDAYDDTVTLTVNTSTYPMLFSVYADIDVDSSLSLTTDKTVIYMGASVKLDIESNYSFNKNNNSDVVYETTHIEDQLGIRITVSSGSEFLTSADLEGIYITYKGLNYFPRSDGSYRIKVADAVSNVLASMTFNTENGKLDTGTYTITAQSFGSIDGTYFSTAIASDSKNIQVVSTNYGFSVNLDSNSVLVDKSTGKNKNDSNDLNFNIGYSGGFESPRITVAFYRRKYDQVYSYEYLKIPLTDYVTNTLTTTDIENEYLVTNLVRNQQNYTLTLKNSGLITGTYKIVFSLYDGQTKISDMDKTIIIK